jgi:hypothetical protein
LKRGPGVGTKVPLNDALERGLLNAWADFGVQRQDEDK